MKRFVLGLVAAATLVATVVPALAQAVSAGRSGYYHGYYGYVPGGRSHNSGHHR
jgi:hypothetical protein